MRIRVADIEQYLGRHLDRDASLDHAAWLIGELRRLRWSSPRYPGLVAQLRAIVDRRDSRGVALDHRTGVRLHSPGVDDLAAHELENLRRSSSMLRPRHPAALDRERAIRLLDQLQRLQRSDRRYRQLIDQLRGLLDGAGDG
jgi:hypothetical protein